MKSSAKYVGLDVHQATTVATVRESSGKIIAHSILPTGEAALLEFFAGMRGAVHVAFEEGTQAQWLHDLLWKRVARVVACDGAARPGRGTRAPTRTPPSSRSCFAPASCGRSTTAARTGGTSGSSRARTKTWWRTPCARCCG